MTKHSVGRNARAFLFGSVLVLVLAITARADSVGYADADPACIKLSANSSDAAATVARREYGRTDQSIVTSSFDLNFNFNFVWYLYELLGQMATLQHGDAQTPQPREDHSRLGLVTIAGSTWLSENDGFQSSPGFKSKDFEDEHSRDSEDRETRRDTVPEPGSMVLFGTGLLGAGGLLRRRRRH